MLIVVGMVIRKFLIKTSMKACTKYDSPIADFFKITKETLTRTAECTPLLGWKLLKVNSLS